MIQKHLIKQVEVTFSHSEFYQKCADHTDDENPCTEIFQTLVNGYHTREVRDINSQFFVKWTNKWPGTWTERLEREEGTKWIIKIIWLFNMAAIIYKM